MKKFINRIVYVLGIIFAILLIAAVIAAIYGYQAMQGAQVETNSILELSLTNNIAEGRQQVSKIEKLIGSGSAAVSLRELGMILDHAKSDEKIKALSIDGSSYISHSKAIEIAEYVRNFKESGKPVYGYGSYFRQGAYIVACEADSIFLNPSGSVDLTGYVSIMMYFKDFFDKYGIKMEVFSAGQFKSYVEAFTRNESSPENDLQVNELFDFWQADLEKTIVERRNVSVSQVKNIFQKNLANDAAAALELSVVDQLLYHSEYDDFLRKKANQEKNPRVSLRQYMQSIDQKNKGKSNVAFVVISDEIVQEDSPYSAKNLSQSFRKIREDDNISHVILRIDSPGGSAYASEEIWHEVELCKKAGKQVIASVSGISASGGYYLMAGCDKIFANPSSVTGSVGVFIAFPVFEEALGKNFDIHTQKIETTPYAARDLTLVNLSEEQKDMYREITQKLYKKFIGRVAEGRNLTEEYVDSISQGRIYTGERALELGLIDSLVSLKGTFAYVQRQLGETKISIEEFPQSDATFLPNLESLGSDLMANSSILMGQKEQSLEKISSILNKKEALALLPFFNIIQ